MLDARGGAELRFGGTGLGGECEGGDEKGAVEFEEDTADEGACADEVTDEKGVLEGGQGFSEIGFDQGRGASAAI